MAYGAILGQNPNLSAYAKKEGLPVNDIRTYPVREGQSISAGDVVNVGAASDGEAETVYKDVVPQDNVENVFRSSPMAGIKLRTMVGKPVVCWTRSDAIHAGATLMDNAGKSLSTFERSGLYSNGDPCDLLTTESEYCLFIYGNPSYRYYYLLSVNGDKITSVNNISNVFPFTPEDNIPIDSTTNLSFYNDGGLTAQLVNITSTGYSLGSSLKLPGNTGASRISACRLPDEGGNKRVCICFSDAGDGNKGKAVIATIDSSNAVTFGNVVTFESGSATAIKCAASEDTVCVAYIVQSQTYVTYITAIGSTITVSGKKEKVNYGTSYYCDIAEIGDKFVCAYSETQGFARTVSASDEITMGAPFMLNDDLTNYPSIAVIGDNHLILAYSDSGNSNYGTTTILEVNGNQIAGSFLDNSSDAIALADGTGGQSIPVGFGGYCECPGVTEGETIDSAGVIAQAVQDGWLQIKSAWDKGYVVGTYTGDGTSNRLIDIGFTPTAVIVANRGDLGANDTGIDYSAAFGITGNPGRAITYGNSPILVETTDNGFIVNTGFYNTSSGTNMNTNLYYYIALR